MFLDDTQPAVILMVIETLSGMPNEEVFKAIADPHRRKILQILKQGSRNAGELAEALPIGKATLSHHLNVLKAAELVRCERRGQQMVYSIHTSVFEDVAAMLLELFRIDRT